jgi:predicted transposase/invertase (TIGR01784 family)
VYINLLTDFGFKRIFGIKEVMITFLNTVLDIEGGIKDLRYGNPEKLGFSQYERKAVYDLYCITGKDEHIIVEIQSASQVYFKDRTLLYA